MLKIPSHIPFRPGRIPVFYGWIILIAGITGIIMSIPGQTMGVSVFTEYLISDLHLTRVQLSSAYMAGTLISGLLITFAGILYDRAGARIIAIGAGLLLAGVLVFLSNMENISSRFIQFFDNGNPAVTTLILMIIGFFGIRFFGQGVLTMTSRNMVMKWFDKRRGLANGFLGVFTAIAFSYSPRVLQQIIEYNSWQETYRILAIALIFFAVFVFVIFRDNPFDAGQIPDGKLIPDKIKGVKSTAEKDSDLVDAVRSYSFWIFTLNITIIALYFTAFTFHVESIFQNAGLDRNVAFSVFLPGALIAAFVHVSGSILSDYIRLKYILIASFVGMLISVFGIYFLKQSGTLLLIAGNGVIIGTFNILIAVTWPRFYGLKNLGKISGFVLSCSVIGSSFGPLFFSLSEKNSGSYKPALLFLGIVCIALLLMSFWANNRYDEGMKSGKRERSTD